MAYKLAGRYRGRGIPLDDMRQVAALALVKAADAFDADRGIAFSSYAIPTITGELRKHFRDHGWWVRPPRPLQELEARVRVAEEQLSQELRRVPTEEEVAEAVGSSASQVRESRGLGSCFAPTHLGGPSEPDPADHATALQSTADTGDAADARLTMLAAVRKLPARDREIVSLRFAEDLTQAQIGERLGITQMQVSRLLTRILADLRASLSPVTDAVVVSIGTTAQSPMARTPQRLPHAS